jgi:putative membrane protein insertion efficiency factor
VSPPKTGPGALARLLITLLRGYQRWISPAFPPVCRFSPSCSAYAVEALQVHGVLRGCWFTVRRLLRCAPWHPGGIDPVPPRRRPTRTARTAQDRAAQNHEERTPC